MNGQDPWIRQTDRPRVVIPGVLPDGGRCTVLLDRVREQWRLYRLGYVEDHVAITDPDLRRAARQILGGQP